MPKGIYKHKNRPDSSERMKKYNATRVISDETRKKLSDANKRRRRYSWCKGGLLKTPLNQLIRRCFEYRQWRSDVFTRDNYTCLGCGARNGNGKSYELNADHIKPLYELIAEFCIKTVEEAINCEELWNINNGRTLCRDCHKKTDTYGSRYKKLKVETE